MKKVFIIAMINALLLAMMAAGCSETPPPEADFIAYPLDGTAPLTLQFFDQSTGEVTARAWDFNNDGITDSTEQSPSYTYETAGTYAVSLEVTGPGGSNTETKTDYITVTAAVPAESERIYLVTYEDVLLLSAGFPNPQITQCQIVLSESDVYPEDMFPPAEYVTVPTGVLSNLYVTNWTYNEALPVRFHDGMPTYLMSDGAFISVADGTPQYIYMDNWGDVMVEVGFSNYTLESGTNIGPPYAVGNSWSSNISVEAFVLDPPIGSVMKGTSRNIATVTAENVTITVPAGTFTDCFVVETLTDDGLGGGFVLSRTDWYSPTLRGLVKTVNVGTADGVETQELQAYT